MRHAIDVEALPYAGGAIGLGIVTLIFGDFALQWQPVPAGIPARSALAALSGIVLIAGGMAALWRGGGMLRLILPAFYGAWVVALHLPRLAAEPNVGSLLGLAEILSLATGGTGLLAAANGTAPWLRPSARIAYGLCPIVFGLSHFVYADFTASMVPSWIPLPLFWAYATGTAHLAAGLAIVTGVMARLAATCLAIMAGLFVALLHAPRVIANPASRLEWTMLCVALSIAGAALVVRRWLDPGRR